MASEVKMFLKKFNLLAALTAILVVNSTALPANDLTAEFQTRLKLLGEQPGVIDGAFGSKTNTAANKYFKTSNKNYREMMSDSNQALIKDLTKQYVDTDEPIFKTTADFIEARNTTVVSRNNGPLWDLALENFDAGRPAPSGGVSKWYQPDITGDGVPDFVLFGMGPGYRSECEVEKCGDAWLRKPILAKLSNEDESSRYSIEVLDQNTVLPGNIFNKGTGGKSIFADFNNDGYDDFYLPSEGPVAGPTIHVGGSDVLLISQGDGTYRDEAFKYDLLKKKSFQHWTAAGDIDNDGDIDFIFHNIQASYTKMKDKIACFLNDGKANFKVTNCVSPPSAKRASRFYNWGGTLFDLNGDNNLDLWLSRDSRNVPIVLLGDGTGKFSSDNYVEVYLPKNWPKVMRQFGYVMAADLEDDGFNEIFFSVQGDSRLSPNDCKGVKGYCGSYVGYFKNVNGFLSFGGFIKKFEKTDRGQWSGSSMIVVKDFIGNDGLKDVYLKRNYDEPFYRQNPDGSFVAVKNGARINQTQLLDIPNVCLTSLETCGDIEICVSGVVIDAAKDTRRWLNNEFEQEGKRRGITCGVDTKSSSKQKPADNYCAAPALDYKDPDWPVSKRPNGTVKSKTVCHYAMGENGCWIRSRPNWVNEAMGRNLDKAFCDFFKSQ
jgi:hypothetical protein